MIRLKVLGGLDLVGIDGIEQRSLLSQPKPLALFIYLTLAKPIGYHRRDELLGLFWPETTSGRGRRSLSQALHVLRGALGADLFDARGTEEIRLREDAVWCDALEFDRALAAGDSELASSLYKGDFLPGFFLADAPDFEQWVSRERASLRDRAAAMAWLRSVSEEEGNNRAAASSWAHRALELAPYDESALRRLMDLLSRSGDRAGAIRAFNEFASRLRRDLSIDPSSETVAAVAALRSGEAGASAARANAADDPVALGENVAEDRVAHIAVRHDLVRSRRPRTRKAVTVGLVALVAVFIGAGALAMRLDNNSEPLPRKRTSDTRQNVLVANFTSAPGDSDIAAAVSEAVRLDLSQSPVIRLLSPSEVREALRLMRRDSTLRLDSALAREVAEREGAKAV